MKNTLTLLAILFSFQLFAQGQFVKGYYVNWQADTVRGLIKDGNWFVSPSKIIFKINTQGSEQIITTDQANMFALSNGEFYYAQSFSYTEIPERVYTHPDELLKYQSFKANAFVRMLLKGSINLYKYVSENTVSHFLIQEREAEPEVLVHEKYIVMYDSVPRSAAYEKEDHKYRIQLIKAMRTEADLYKRIETLGYSDADLIKLISLYNKRQSTISENLTNKTDKMQLFIRPRVATAINRSKNINSYYGAFAAADFVLPRSASRWVLFAEAGYHSISVNSYRTTFTAVDSLVKEQVNSFVINAGARAYLLKTKLTPFVCIGGTVYYSNRADNRLFFFGTGLSVNRRLELDVSYKFKPGLRDLKNNRYSFIDVSLAYRFPVSAFFSSK